MRQCNFTISTFSYQFIFFDASQCTKLLSQIETNKIYHKRGVNIQRNFAYNFFINRNITLILIIFIFYLLTFHNITKVIIFYIITVILRDPYKYAFLLFFLKQKSKLESKVHTVFEV